MKKSHYCIIERYVQTKQPGEAELIVSRVTLRNSRKLDMAGWNQVIKNARGREGVLLWRGWVIVGLSKIKL